MKKLFCIAIVLCAAFIVCGSSFAGDDEVKYQVDITIRYNAVSPEKAAQIARQIMIDHTSACKTEVKMTLPEQILTIDGDVTWSDGGGGVYLQYNGHSSSDTAN